MSQHGPRSQRQEVLHGTHILPITALAYLDDDIILSGEGSFLCAYHEQDQRCLGTWRVFKSQAVHGIVVDSASKDILIFGGRLLSVGRLSYQHDATNFSSHTALQIDDWILDASFRDSQVALVTAHNALLTVRQQQVVDGSRKQQWVVTPQVSGSNTILYCAHIQQTAHDHWLIAAGTAFGDVIIWSCRQASTQQVEFAVHYTFSAHEGSTFGVHISDDLPDGVLSNHKRLLASCSDDRTVRVWDISDLASRIASSVACDRSTGFGSRDDKSEDENRPVLLARAMGHVSRIWHVRFQHARFGIVVKSFGEDATTITWALHQAVNSSTPFNLVQTSIFGTNAGKHIWSVASNGRGKFIVGGADGAIACIPPLSSSSRQEQELECGPTDSDKETRAKDVLKAYAFMDACTLITTTLRGRVVSYKLNEGQPSIIHTFEQSDLANYSVIAAAPGLAFAGGNGSTIYAYLDSSSALIPIECSHGKTAALFACSTEDASVDAIADTALLIAKVNQTKANLKLFNKQSDKTVGLTLVNDIYYNLANGLGVIESAYVQLEDNTVLSILGSRYGTAAIYKHDCTSLETASLDAVLMVPIHTGAITSLVWRASAEHQATLLGHMFSTSRDGTYAIHELHSSSNDAALEATLVHQLELPFGPYIGGLSLLSDDQLLAWGFRSKHFIVYSVKIHQEIFTMDCGGAHRNWAVWPHNNGLTFVWTKASKVFVKHVKQSMTRLIKTGGHGREVKSMAVKRNTDGSALVATGAQDTNIRLFATDSSSNELSCSHILRQHNTGPQHLAFTDEGEYLFSSGGFEEFFVWRLTQACPIFGTGVVCESIYPRSGKSDLRIMGFETRYRPSTSDWQIAMAFSDSRAGIWSYSRLQGWRHLIEADYLTSCLTSISRPSSAGDYVTTATDGHICLWRHSHSIDQLDWTSRHRAHQGAILCSSSYRYIGDDILMVTGGDDNAIAFTALGSTSKENGVLTYSITRAHAAAVTALEIIPSSQHARVMYLISAGLDQHLILWEITMHGSTLKARKLQTISSCVADISSVNILPHNSQATISLVVSGIGMEIWTIPLPTQLSMQPNASGT